MKKIDSHIIRGMTKDAAVSIFKPDMAIDAHNIRLGIDSDNSLYTISNEKGTGKVDINWSGAIWNEQNITSIEGTISSLSLSTPPTWSPWPWVATM